VKKIAKIMTVDNEPDTVEFVKMLLEKEGFNVVTAFSGRECLDKLKKNGVELVLLDIMMPDMSGWDVYTQIKKLSHRPKVAFLSAIDVSDERRKVLMKNGIADYITKPFDNDDLVNRVKKIVGSK
jgi:two-component system response regulator VicR